MQDGYLTGTVVRELGNKEKLSVNRWGREQVGRASRRQVGFVYGVGKRAFRCHQSEQAGVSKPCQGL